MLRGEADATTYSESLSRAGGARMSAATYVEIAAVIDGQGDPVLSGALDELLRTYLIQIVPLTEVQARLARVAYQRFGKGSGHPAHLNMGDCYAYALARDTGEPLLFKGKDFALTDIEIVVEPIKERRLSEVLSEYGAATT